jgi:hypothetical protein
MKNKAASELRIDRLYHYLSFDKPERLALIFTEGTLYFSTPRDFNDPWDCRPFYNKSSLNDAGEYERAVRWFVHCDRIRNPSLSEEEHVRREKDLRGDRKLLEWMIDQLTSEMGEAIQKQYRVYCLSTHPDSTLMWAHYANSCKGLCLEFSVQNKLFCKALPVEYLTTYPLFTVWDNVEDANLRVLLTKSDAWSYESEFRLIASEEPFVFPDVPTTKGGFMQMPKDALKSVIMGAQMEASDREMVRELVRDSGWGVELKVANLVPDRYAFNITTLK